MILGTSSQNVIEHLYNLQYSTQKKYSLPTGVNEITSIAYRENLRYLESEEHLDEASLHTVQYFHSSLCIYYSINQRII